MKNIQKMARLYAKRVGSPYCLAFLKLGPQARAQDILSLQPVSPYHVTNATRYFEDAQLAALFSKRRDLDAGVSPKIECLKSWLDAEQRCRVTNQKLRRISNGDGPKPLCDVAILEFLEDVRVTLTRWLGPAPRLCDLEPKFGPGSTTSLKEDIGIVLPDKLTSVPDATLELACEYEDIFPLTGWGQTLLEECYGISPHKPNLINLVECARFTTVRKKATIDRPIEIQADLNVALQLAVGAHLKDCAKRVGWDLKKAPDIHRQVARVASITGALSTDDLKSASDLICYELVRLTFPSDWFKLFDVLRHKRVSIEGRPILLEKFSGMGNGYTFELETFLFMAICHECLKRGGIQPKIGKNLYTFGDDIIVDSLVQNRTVRTLELLGFVVNTTKSFGPDVGFKESCGEDYFNGRWVRPFFPKEEPYDTPSWISFANGIRRVGINHYGADVWSISALYRLYLDAIECIPVADRLWGPERFGDSVLHTEDTTLYETRLRHNRVYLRCIRFVPRKLGRRSGGAYVEWDNFPIRARLKSSLYLLSFGSLARPSDDLGLVPRDPIGGWKRGWVQFGTSPC